MQHKIYQAPSVRTEGTGSIMATGAQIIIQYLSLKEGVRELLPLPCKDVERTLLRPVLTPHRLGCTLPFPSSSLFFLCHRHTHTGYKLV